MSWTQMRQHIMTAQRPWQFRFGPAQLAYGAAIANHAEWGEPPAGHAESADSGEGAGGEKEAADEAVAFPDSTAAEAIGDRKAAGSEDEDDGGDSKADEHCARIPHKLGEGMRGVQTPVYLCVKDAYTMTLSYSLLKVHCGFTRVMFTYS